VKDVTNMQDTKSVMNSSDKKRRVTLLVWLVSAALVIVGVVVIVMGLHGPRVGPNLPSPVGQTSMNSSSAPRGTESMARTSVPLNGARPLIALTALQVSARRATSLPSTDLVTSARVVKSKGIGVTRPEPLIRNSRLATTTTIARSIPLHLSIPSLGISVPLTQLGLTASGAVQIPTNFAIPGWYDEGYAPGQIGSAAILGHVDSTKGPGVFYRIVGMKVGQRVKVTLTDHQQLTFAVIGVRQYAKNEFPNRLVYGPKAYSALNLVTCGGVFDPTSHHYLSNIVVFTKLVSSK
jgi:hypothetical protein